MNDGAYAVSASLPSSAGDSSYSYSYTQPLRLRPSALPSSSSSSPFQEVLSGTATGTALLLAALFIVGELVRRILRRLDMQGIALLALERSRKAKASSTVALAAAGTGNGRPALPPPEEDDENNCVNLDGSGTTYPGLLNTSTTCYLNSVVQSLASSPSFLAYLRNLLESAPDGVHLEFTLTLYTLLRTLNTASPRSSILRTNNLVHSLTNSSSSSNASRNRKRIMQGSGQQDAHEFFLILTETIEEEKKVLYASLEKKRLERNGLLELLIPSDELLALTRIAGDDALKNPFEGKTAHRTSCMTCGYAEAIRHRPAENITLNVPSTRSCRLEAILAEHTQLELIDEYTCRRCSVLATHYRLSEQVKTQKQEASSASASKKKRMRELQRTVARLQEIIAAQDYEADMTSILNNARLDRAAGPASKQIMYSSPPRLLVIHLSRSSFSDGGYGYSAKNHCQVVIPEYLDMDPYTTSDTLSMKPNQPISSWPKPKDGDAEVRRKPQNVYRITSLVVHFGSHSNGHYVSFRRRPTSMASGRISDEWFRISDEDVDLSTVDEMLRANPFLLFYERVDSVLTSAKTSRTVPIGEIIESWQVTAKDIVSGAPGAA